MTSTFALEAERFDLAHPSRPRRFVRPDRPGFWVYAVLVVVGLGVLAWQLAPSAGNPGVWAVGGIWLLWAWLGYCLIARADLLEVAPTGVRLAALVWGAAGAMVTGRFEIWAGDLLALSGSWSNAVLAPPFEDGMKLLGVVLVATVVPHVVRRRMGAVMVGLLVGLGFSFTENWLYTSGLVVQDDLSDVPGLVLLRGVVGAPAHPAFAVLGAVGVWYVLAHPRRPLGLRLLVALGCAVAGSLLHAGHDAPFTGAAAVAVHVLEFATVIVVVVWARRGEREWVVRTTANGVPRVSAEDGRTLASRRARRAARREARPRGRDAVHTVTRRQHTQLAYLNALDAGTDEETLDRMRRQLR